jgi:hypothetical protein
MERIDFSNRKVYLLGCTHEASELLRGLGGLICVTGILDVSDNWTEETFCGYSVYGYTVMKKNIDGLMVDCSTPYYDPSYMEDRLIHDGFAVYSDFIDYVYFSAVILQKHIMIISGFCHADDIFRGLVQLPLVCERYNIFNFSYDVKNMTKYSSRILNRLIRLCSVYIYNYNAGAQLNFTREELPADCRSICLPLVRFHGIWPQIHPNHSCYENVYYILPTNSYDGAFVGGDLEINRYIDEGLGWKKIYSQIAASDFYSHIIIDKTLALSFRQMEYSEKNGELKIVEFIKNNFHKQRLFKDYRHIDNPIAFEYIRQIGELLGIEVSAAYIKQYIPQDLHPYTEMPVYPGVAAHLGLEWVTPDTKYCIRSYHGEKYVTFEAYVRWYYNYAKAVRDVKENW